MADLPITREQALALIERYNKDSSDISHYPELAINATKEIADEAGSS